MFQLQDFNPYPVTIDLFGSEFELSPFTLKYEAWAIEKYSKEGNSDGLEIMRGLISELNPKVILELSYRLIANKSPFPTFGKYLEKFSTSKSLKDHLIPLHNAVVLAINNSQPRINLKREKELMKIKNVAASDVCYGRYYDRIAKRYGYTIEDFYNLTIRQLHGLLRISDDEGYKELEIKASLAGRKLKPRDTPLDMTVEEEKEADDHALTILKRMRTEHALSGMKNNGEK